MGECEIQGKRPTVILPGKYEMTFQYHETRYLFGRAPKLYCHFKIVSIGDYFEQVVVRYYNLKSIKAKPRKGGAFQVGWHSDFVREYAMLFGLPQRLDRISCETFKGKIISGAIGTVSRNHKQKSLPDGLQYSVVTELIEVVQ